MSFSLADARFAFDRATGLVRRGWLSLRTRGLRASWQRLRAHLRRVPVARRAKPYFPADEPRVPSALATGDAPVDQPRPLQHLDVLGRRGKGHPSRTGQVPDRAFSPGHLADHAAPGAVRQRLKDTVDLFRFFNHVVEHNRRYSDCQPIG